MPDVAVDVESDGAKDVSGAGVGLPIVAGVCTFASVAGRIGRVPNETETRSTAEARGEADFNGGAVAVLLLLGS